MKKNLLYVINLFINEIIFDKQDVNGGTALNLLDIIENKEIKKKFNIFILYIGVDGTYKLNTYINGKEERYALNIEARNRYFMEKNTLYREMLEKIIMNYNIDIIHVQHLMDHYVDIVDIVEEYKIPTVISVHDYFLLCPNVNLLDAEDIQCAKISNRECCNKCTGADIDTNHRVDIIKRLLQNSSKIVIPNETVRENFNKLYGDLEYTVIEHGIRPFKERKKDRKDNNFNIAFVGVLIKIKGKNKMKYLVDNINNEKIKFHLFGITDEEELKVNTDNYTYHGTYSKSDIEEKLTKNKIDLVCILSICHETFSYVLSESVNAKIPVMGFDVGAVGNRIKKLNCGITLDLKISDEELKNKIIELSDFSDEYITMRNNMSNTNLETVKQMQDKYRELYNNIEISNKNRRIVTRDATKFIEGSVEIVNPKDIKKMMKKVIRHIKANGIKETIKIIFAKISKK